MYPKTSQAEIAQQNARDKKEESKENSPIIATVLGSWVRTLCQTIKGYDIDAIALAEEAGIDTSRFNIPEARYPLVSVRQLWKLAIEKTGDPLIGLRMGDEIQAGALHGLGLAMITSNSLGHLLDLVARYGQVLSSTMHIQSTHTAEKSTLTVNTLAGDEPAHAARITMLAFVFRQAQRLSQHNIKAVEVTLAMKEIPDSPRLNAYFKSEVRLGAEADSISFSAKDVAESYACANPLLQEVNEKAINEYLERMKQARISDRVLLLIKELLPRSEPRLSMIAKHLNLSERTLQRKLDAEKQSFLGLLDKARQTLANRWLVHSDLSVVEISYRLSFSDPSCFCRACHRWFAHSPSEHRRLAVQKPEEKTLNLAVS